MVEFINQFKLDYYGKPVKIGWPFRPSIGFLITAHPRFQMPESNPGALVSWMNP